jgi:hypothetical protein
VRDRWRGNWDDADEGIQTGEVGRVRRVQRQALGDCRGGDHHIDGPAPWLTACGNDGRRHATEDARRLGVERQRIELTLGPLQDLQPPRALGVLVVCILLVVCVLPRPTWTQLMKRIVGY